MARCIDWMPRSATRVLSPLPKGSTLTTVLSRACHARQCGIALHGCFQLLLSRWQWHHHHINESMRSKQAQSALRSPSVPHSRGSHFHLPQQRQLLCNTAGYRTQTAARSTLATETRALTNADELAGYLERVAECNVGRERIRGPDFVKLTGSRSVYGFTHESFATQLCTFKDTFVRTEKGTIELHPSLQTFEARNEAVAAVCSALREKGLINGWRDELYPVGTGFHDRPNFLLERAAAPHFGITAYGVHMNGYTEDADGNLHLWVARRSKTKQTWPLRLDHLVAGGQPFGLGCKDNLIKECQEEAGIGRELAQRAISAGVVSYETVVEDKAKRDVLFVYELKVPLDFRPVNKDGEVESFELWPLARVAETIRTSTEYKPNVALVIIDFLIRHGFITPDQRGYLELLSQLRTVQIL